MNFARRDIITMRNKGGDFLEQLPQRKENPLMGDNIPKKGAGGTALTQ